MPTPSYSKQEQEEYLEFNTGLEIKDRNVKLSKEYEIMGYLNLAEKRIKQLIVLGHTHLLFDYCKLQLRSGNHAKAEEALVEVLSHGKIGEDPNVDHITLLCLFYIKKNRYKEAFIILKHILEKNPTSIMHNLLIAILYKDCLDQK